MQITVALLIFFWPRPQAPQSFSTHALKKIGEPGDKANNFLLWMQVFLKKKANLNNLIHGGFGSTWGDNFYMGTQNGSKLEI